MTRLYVVCEGLTELNFIEHVLRPHLSQVDRRTILMGPPNRRGYHTYANLRKHVRNLLSRPNAEVRVTTLIDLHGLPADFPGLKDTSTERDPHRLVEGLEARFAQDITDSRFYPHLQLHEFEALLFADLTCLATYYPNRSQNLAELASKIESEFATPEHINRERPPSKRILEVVPEYSKEAGGTVAALSIGLERIREKCRHFNGWMQWIERLG